MPRSAVVEAVDARLASEWTETLVVGFSTSQEPPADPATGNPILDGDGNVVPWLTVQYPLAETRHLTLDGEGPAEERGIILLRLHTVRGFGLNQTLEWGDQLADLFHRKFFDGVRCGDASSPRLDDDADLGNYLQTSIRISYTFQFDTTE